MVARLLWEQDVAGSNPVVPTISCGRSSMVEPQPSKLMTRVRFPSPAPSNIIAGQSTYLACDFLCRNWLMTHAHDTDMTQIRFVRRLKWSCERSYRPSFQRPRFEPPNRKQLGVCHMGVSWLCHIPPVCDWAWAVPPSIAACPALQKMNPADP